MLRVEALSSQPESGSRLSEDDRQLYRQIFQGAYRVIYRYENGIVWIVAVYHSARLLSDDDVQVNRVFISAVDEFAIVHYARESSTPERRMYSAASSTSVTEINPPSGY